MTDAGPAFQAPLPPSSLNGPSPLVCCAFPAVKRVRQARQPVGPSLAPDGSSCLSRLLSDTSRPQDAPGRVSYTEERPVGQTATALQSAATEEADSSSRGRSF